MHANDVVGPCSFINGTVWGADFYHLLDTYIHAEAQWFPQNAALRKNGANLHIIVPSLLFWIKCFWIHGLKDYIQGTGQQDLGLFLSCFFLWESVKDQVNCTRVPNELQLDRRKNIAFRTVNNDIFNNVWISLEIRLHAVIPESGGIVKNSNDIQLILFQLSAGIIQSMMSKYFEHGM